MASKRYNGKPMSYWEREAKKHMVWLLVRAAESYCDQHSIIGRMAKPRLLQLAMAEGPDLVQECYDEMNACSAGFQAIMSDILDNPKKHPTLNLAVKSVNIRKRP